MQITKQEIKNRLINSSRELFLEKGYSNVTMRNIAERAEIGLSNIYNYVSNKEELFKIIVQPVISKLIKITEKNSNIDRIKLNINDYDKFIENIINDYTSVIYKYRTEITILLFRSQGCTFETFKQDFSNRVTEVFKNYLKVFSETPNYKTINVSDEFIHLHTIWIFALFEDVILNNIKDKKLDNLIKEYIKYEAITWKEIVSRY